MSDTDIEIEVEQDEELDGVSNTRLLLSVHYPNAYPDSPPELKLTAVDSDFTEKEIEKLVEGLLTLAEENIGMAMTFTLVTHLREQLTNLAQFRKKELERLEQEKERKLLEEEEARTRGTPVSVESFRKWKAKFDKEIALSKAKEEDEKLKGLTPKEREEHKRAQGRLTGRQLFERNKNLAEGDESLIEEGAVSVDASQYERTQDEDEHEEGLTYSDSD